LSTASSSRPHIHTQTYDNYIVNIKHAIPELMAAHKEEYFHKGFGENERVPYYFPEQSCGRLQAYNHCYWSRSSAECERLLIVFHNTT